ncbi:MAG: hypothetical protein ACTSWE_10630, partial [Promethearchaeota archaeon]
NELPNVDDIPLEHKDILRHVFYHLNESFKEKNEQSSMKRFTKGVFKFAFLMCVFHDGEFKFTHLSWIFHEIKKLVKEDKIDIYLLEILSESMNFRRGSLLKKSFP